MKLYQSLIVGYSDTLIYNDMSLFIFPADIIILNDFEETKSLRIYCIILDSFFKFDFCCVVDL